MKPKISVIIPCFNEEIWVGATITQLLICPLASEIIAVDDGSKDKTLQILKLFEDKIKIISFEKNKGKGAALAEGVKKARGEIVVFADAHHLNIKNSHIKTLTSFLIKNQADAVLGTTVGLIPDPFWRFTGFRAYWKKDLLPYLSRIKKTRFGVEIYLNEIFKKKRVKLIYPKGLIHLAKPQKMPLSKVPIASINQFIEMTQVLAQVKGIKPQKIKEILNPKKIKTFKELKKTVQKLKNKQSLSLRDKKITKLLKDHILSYFEK